MSAQGAINTGVIISGLGSGLQLVVEAFRASVVCTDLIV